MFDKNTHAIVYDDGSCLYRQFPVSEQEWIDSKIVVEIFYFEPANEFCVTFAPYLVVEKRTLVSTLKCLNELNNAV